MKQKLKNILILIIAYIVGLCTMEVTLRVLKGPPIFDLLKLSPIEGLLFEHKRNVKIEQDFFEPQSVDQSTGRIVYQKSTIEYGINSMGFRDEKFTLEQLHGNSVILVLGDSTTFGIGVPMQDTYPKVLERFMKRSDASIRVINAGVWGYNLAQYSAYLRHLVHAVDPCSVIVGVYMNDHIPQPKFKRLGFFLKNNLRSINTLMDLLDRLFEYFNRWSYNIYKKKLHNILNEKSAQAIDMYTKMFNCNKYRLFHDIKNMNNLELWQSALKKIAEIKTTCDNNNIPLVCLIFPVRYQLLFGYDNFEAQKIVSDYLTQQSIPFIDITPIFKSAIQNDIVLYNTLSDGWHFNRNGHQLIAERIGNKIRLTR